MTLPLTVTGVTVNGDDGRIILKLDALSVPAGALVGVRGPSGAGKSTLLYVLAGLVRVAGGSVRWGETAIDALSEEGRASFRRESIGMIFQDFLLFEELTATANAGLAGAYAASARRGAIAGRAAEMLDRLAVPRAARSVASFSGGERQRVSVARALAGDPAVILADEPTASLDRAAADRLVDDLVGLARQFGKTLIAVSHDPAVHASMDRLIDIADGRLAGDAPVQASRDA